MRVRVRVRHEPSQDAHVDLWVGVYTEQKTFRAAEQVTTRKYSLTRQLDWAVRL